MKEHWSTLKKLIWLYATKLKGGASAIIETITGTLPLVLQNAISHAIVSLTRYGLCTQDGTPTPDAPVDILCNNGALRYGKPLTIDPTRISAYINENGYWLYSSDSYSIAVPVEVGTKVAIRFTNTDSSVVGSIFRYGFRNNATPDEPTSATMLSQVYRGTPQEREYFELTADRPYLIIQLSSSRAAHILSSGYLVVSKQEIYTDGTPEVLTVSGKNLFDPTKVLFGYYRDFSTGNKRTSSANFMSSDDGYIPCLPNTAYTFVGTNKTDGTYSKYNTIYFFDSAKNYLGASSYQISQPTTGTTPSNCRYLQVRSNPLDTVSASIQDVFQQFNWQLELGSTVTDYEPYATPQTASVPTLLGVGDDKDEAELIQGIKTGKVGVKVLNGTENWANLSNYYNLSKTDLNTNSTVLPLNSTSIICTHLVAKSGMFTDGIGVGASYVNFKYDTIAATLDAWKAWLAAQYAAGTPVIIVYPLATETTEQTTAQHLVTHEGTNIVDSTANVEPVEAKVEYYATPTTPPLLGMMGPTEPQDEPEAAEPEESEESEEI